MFKNWMVDNELRHSALDKELQGVLPSNLCKLKL